MTITPQEELGNYMQASETMVPYLSTERSKSQVRGTSVQHLLWMTLLQAFHVKVAAVGYDGW